MASVELRLVPAWNQLLAPFGARPAKIADVWTNLQSAYSNPDRFYHNLSHIAQVLDTIASLCDLAHDWTALNLAAWFHDVVYDSRAKDNEERSVTAARAALPALGIPAATIERVADLIVATKTHQAKAEDRDAQILLDADLAILGAPEAEYEAYAQAIGKEYAWVPDEDYRRGRRAVLERFLGRKRIFQTQPPFVSRETQARLNLQREITQLAG